MHNKQFSNQYQLFVNELMDTHDFKTLHIPMVVITRIHVHDVFFLCIKNFNENRVFILIVLILICFVSYAT